MKLTTTAPVAASLLLCLLLLLAVCARADVYSFMECLDASYRTWCDFDDLAHCHIPRHYFHIDGMPKHGDCLSQVRSGACYESLSGSTSENRYSVKFVCSGNVTRHLHVELNIWGLVIEDVGTTRCYAELTARNQSGIGICGESFE